MFNRPANRYGYLKAFLRDGNPVVVVVVVVNRLFGWVGGLVGLRKKVLRVGWLVWWVQRRKKKKERDRRKRRRGRKKKKKKKKQKR